MTKKANTLPDKWKALDIFWNSFGWVAYEENIVPDDAGNEYITYEAKTGHFDDPILLTAHLWQGKVKYWDTLNAKVNEITAFIKNAYAMPIQGGRMIIRPGSPYVQDEQDGSKLGKMILYTAEFITAKY